MAVYQLRDWRSGLVQNVVSAIFFGALIAMTVLPMLTGDAPKEERAGRIGIFVVFILIGCIANAWERRKVREIRVADDGTIQFVRGNGRVKEIGARDIRMLEGGYSRDYDGNYTIWSFSILSIAGNFTVGSFPNVMDFVERVQALNPDVWIIGLWPLNPLSNLPQSRYHV